jgi:hypothetical protein
MILTVFDQESASDRTSFTIEQLKKIQATSEEQLIKDVAGSIYAGQ